VSATSTAERVAPPVVPSATTTHLYELIRGRARVFPWAVTLGGQNGLTWKTLSSRQVLDLVDRLAAELSELGIREGDRVVLWVPNLWRTPIYLFALWKLGAVVVPFDREMNPDAGARIVQSVEARCVLVGYDERPAWLRDSKVVEWWEPGTRQASGNRDWTPPAEELATISFTSGTTGDPKGCMITHANLLSQLDAARERIPLGPDCSLASILPLSHLFELTAGMLYPVSVGAAVHYIPSRRGPDITRVLSEQHITHMLVVPQMLAMMGQAVEDRLAARFSERGYAALKLLAERLPFAARRHLFWMVHSPLGGRLRLLACGGAALPPEIQRLWERFGIRVLQGYGTSECSPIVACGAAEGGTPPGSIGRPLRGVDVRLSGEGELLVRGRNVMRGYWKDPSRTAEVLDIDGWYATGDLARIDTSGNIFLLGRARDLIVLPSGMKVWPEDVEAVLRAHSAVQDAAIVAVPTPGGGATLHAYLLPGLAVDRTSDLTTILAECNGRLAKHQRVASASWWEGTDFPRTNLLKVRRHLLPRPTSVVGVRVESVLAADDPVGQAIAGAAGVSSVRSDQTLSELGVDSLGLVDLTLSLEEKTGKTIADGALHLDMTVAQVRNALLHAADVQDGAAQAEPREPNASPPVPMWPYTWGRAFRVLSFPVDLLYRFGVTRTVTLGREHLADLPPQVIFASTHHSFPDMPLVHYALARSGGEHTPRRLVTAIAAGGFNSGGPQLGGGLGLYPWWGILALGLYPLRQDADTEASLRGLARVAAAGNDILIFPQGIHVPPADERAENPAARFRPGVAHLASDLGVPVVPIGVAGTEKVMPYKPSEFRGRLVAGVPVSITRGPLAIAFGPALSFEPSESLELFTLRLQKQCYALTRRAEEALKRFG
jgi:long-chain acyl-CoA synthetase